jgi:acyl dehydratase
MVAYAGATWDFHRYHYDLAHVQALGLPAPFVDRQMLGALLAKQIMDWAGPDAFLRRLSFRFRSMVYPGELVIGQGMVAEKKMAAGCHLVVCSLTLCKEDGTEVISPAAATVELLTRGS